MSRWLRWRLVLDRLVALPLLAGAAPVVAMAAVVVRRDGSPALIRVTRIGRDGVPFRMWKIRTMAPGRPDGLAGGVALTARDDVRVTSAGRLLRRARFDELPQLWNIARGEMGLVGPRPEAPEYVDLTSRDWQAVLEAPPGVAGVTQALVREWEPEVIASGGEDAYRQQILPLKLAIDRWYVRAACPAVDLDIARALLGVDRAAARRRLLTRVIDGGVVEAASLRDV